MGTCLRAKIAALVAGCADEVKQKKQNGTRAKKYFVTKMIYYR